MAVEACRVGKRCVLMQHGFGAEGFCLTRFFARVIILMGLLMTVIVMGNLVVAISGMKLIVSHMVADRRLFALPRGGLEMAVLADPVAVRVVFLGDGLMTRFDAMVLVFMLMRIGRASCR